MKHVARLFLHIAEFLLKWVPSRLIVEPERYTLALCMLVIGIDAVFLGAPGSVLGGIPEARLYNTEIGICLIFGGSCKIIGLWYKVVWLMRLGSGFLIMGSLGTCIGVFFFGQPSDYPVIILFALLTLTYSLRLLKSTAERIKLHGGSNGGE